VKEHIAVFMVYQRVPRRQTGGDFLFFVLVVGHCGNLTLHSITGRRDKTLARFCRFDGAFDIPCRFVRGVAVA